jgi:hypothetical protein
MKISFKLTVYMVCWVLLLALVGCEENAAVGKNRAENYPQDAKPQAMESVEAAAGDTASTEASQAEQGLTPKIVVEKTVYDYGDIDPGSTNKGEFTFSNQGQGELIIDKIQSTCGCTVPELKKKTYLQGESGTIDVTFRPGQRSGPITKHLYIQSNDKENPRAELTIKANVVKKISYEPSRFRLRLDEENAGIGNINIKSVDDKKFAVSSIKVVPECMTIGYDPAAEASEFDLHPVVDMNEIKNIRAGNITIKLTHPSQKIITIPFDLLPPFKTDPATLIALNVSAENPVQKTVYVLSNYDEEFEVKSVTPSTDAIKIISQEYIENTYHINLEIAPPSDIGTKRYFDSKLTIKMAGGEEVVINCVGSVLQK